MWSCIFFYWTEEIRYSINIFSNVCFENLLVVDFKLLLVFYLQAANLAKNIDMSFHNSSSAI